MASTYSTNLAIELIGTGDQAGTWGTTTNSNLGTLIEQSISGYVTQAVSTGTDTTITIPNGSTGVARNMYIELTGTGGSNTNLVVPANKKLYFIFNNSTGAVTVKVSAQTGVSVPTGKKMVLVSNGTDIVNGLNYIADFATNSFTVTNLTASSGTITNLIATSGSITNLVSSDASATVLRAGSATLTHLSATSATITNLTLTSLVISNLSIASANITTLTSASATITNLLATSLAVSSIATFAAGSAAAPSITTTGDTNTGLFFPAADTIAFTEGGVESMRIDSSANVGIGTASPVTRLQLGGATDKTIRIDSSNGNAGFYGVYQNSTIVSANRNPSTGAITDATKAAASFTLLSNVSDAFITFATTATNNTEPTERMRLDASGNLGLQTAGTTYTLGSAFQLGRVFSFAQDINSGYLGAGWFGTNSGTATYAVTGNYAVRQSFDSSAGAIKFFTAPTGTAGDTVSFTQAMTLSAAGDLGVGTTNTAPANGEGMCVGASSTITRIDMRNSTTGDTSGDGTSFYLNGNDFTVENRENGFVAFSTNNTERCRILAGGNFIVGGTSATEGGLFVTSFNGAAVPGVVIEDTSGVTTANMLFFYKSGAVRGAIQTTASATTYGTSSDYRLKTVIGAVSNAGQRIDALEPVEYTWNANGERARGFLAHQFQEVYVSSVSGTKDAVDVEGNPVYQSMQASTSEVIADLVAELQSLRKRVAELESK